LLQASILASPLKAAANGTALILQVKETNPYLAGSVLILAQLAQKEKERGEDFVLELNRISYQSRRISVIQKHPRDRIMPLLSEKSVDLLAAIIEFLTAAIMFLQHGFFCEHSIGPQPKLLLMPCY
jgi:hypothetical protein